MPKPAMDPALPLSLLRRRPRLDVKGLGEVRKTESRAEKLKWQRRSPSHSFPGHEHGLSVRPSSGPAVSSTQRRAQAAAERSHCDSFNVSV